MDTASFNNINVFQGIFLTKQFLYDGSLDQRFILNNSFIDTSTIKVYISKSPNKEVLNILFRKIFSMLIKTQEYSSLMKYKMKNMN